MNRRFSFIPTAPRSVRIDRAVRPCLPITLPKIALRHPQFENRDLLAVNLVDHYFVRHIHQSPGDVFHQCLYAVVVIHGTPYRRVGFSPRGSLDTAYPYPEAAVAGFDFISRATVSDGCAPDFIQ